MQCPPFPIHLVSVPTSLEGGWSSLTPGWTVGELLRVCDWWGGIQRMGKWCGGQSLGGASPSQKPSPFTQAHRDLQVSGTWVGTVVLWQATSSPSFKVLQPGVSFGGRLLPGSPPGSEKSSACTSEHVFTSMQL